MPEMVLGFLRSVAGFACVYHLDPFTHSRTCAVSRLRKLLLMDEHACPWWFSYTFDNPLRRLVHDPNAILRGLVREGQTVVDVGCGAGYFSLALASMVGAGGKVIALDIQRQMLDRARSRAKRRGLDRMIEFRLCEPDGLGIDETVDFVLTFWMVHEVSDQKAFLDEVRTSLKPSGLLLLVEPKVHVPAPRFEETVDLARTGGFEVVPGPKVWFSRSVACSPSASARGEAP
jgi:2-polyprenyl-3-methyl-5-hydroxy-6-metoxy-1,4-benzoquinol methylase